MKTKKLLSILLAVLMIATTLQLCAFAEVEKGETIGNLEWSIDMSTGTLIIDCDGNMPEIAGKTEAPWYKYSPEIAHISFGEKITGISNYAFYDCTNLTSVTVPEGVKHIGRSAFENCSFLEEILLPSTLTDIGSNAFRETEYYNNEENWSAGVLYIGTNLIKAEKTFKGECKIKEGTTVIAGKAFSECSGLTGVTFPDTLVTIGESAFYYCTGITELLLPGSLKKIEDSAFESCSVLKTVILGDGVETIGESAFKNCAEIEKLHLSRNLKKMSGWVFAYCKMLAEVTIPDSVTEIGDYCFYQCAGLKSVVLGAGIKTVGPSAFYNCKELGEITLGDNIESIKALAFDRTKYSEDNSRREDGILYIGNYLISVDSAVTDAVIKEGVTLIADTAFREHKNLKTVRFPETLKIIGEGSFMGCDGLKEIDLPDSVKRIGVSAFESCTEISKIRIGTGVEIIERKAFFLCTGVPSIILFSNVSYLGEMAFGECLILNDITIYNDECEISDGAIPSRTTVHCFKGAQAVSYCKVNGNNFVYLTTTHIFGEWVITTYPTCKQEGLKIRYCTECPAVEEATLDPLGHKYGNWITDVDSTCTETGLEHRACERCGSEQTRDTDVKAHDYSISRTSPATCTQEGSKTDVCKDCGAIRITKIKTTSHSYRYLVSGSTATYACSICGKISKKNVKVSVSLSGTKFSYNGENRTPSVTAKVDSKTLKRGTDYTLTYANNKKVGKATVTVKFKGNYSGTKKLTFTIVPKTVTKLKAESNAKKTVKVSFSKVGGATGYEIWYKVKGSSGDYKKLKVTKDTAYTDKKLTSGKSYYFRVRAYKTVKGEKYYGYYSDRVTVKVK